MEEGKVEEEVKKHRVNHPPIRATYQISFSNAMSFFCCAKINMEDNFKRFV